MLVRFWPRFVAHVRGRGEWWWAPLAYVACVLFIYRDLWSQGGVRTAFGWDTTGSYGPDLSALARDLADGHWSLWNPFDRGGFPVDCDPVPARGYPLNWPLIGLGALLGTPWWLIQVKVLVHHVIAGAAMHLWLRSRQASRLAALMGGVTLVASAPFLVHKASNLLWPMVWTPLVWLAIDRLCESRRPAWTRGAWLGGALVLVGSAGSPPGMFYVLLMALPYGAFRLLAVLRATPASERRRWAAGVGLALAVAATMSTAMLAIVILPAEELVGVAVRADQHGTGFALSQDLSARASVLGLLSPVPTSQVYMGLGLPLLIGLVVVYGRRLDGGVLWPLLALMILGLLLSAGNRAPLLPWLADHVPGFDRLRVAGRYKFLTAFAAAGLAGLAVQALQSRAPPASGRARLRALIPIAVVALLCTMAMAAADASVPLRAVLALLLAIGLVGALVLGTGRTPAAAALGLVLLVPCDTTGADRKFPQREVVRTHEDDGAVLARLGDVQVAWRLYDEFVLADRVGAREQVRDFRGYPAVDPLSDARYVEVLEHARQHPEILEAFNVRWVLWGPHYRAGYNASFLDRAPSTEAPAHFAPRGQGAHEALHPAPLAVHYSAVCLAPSPPSGATRSQQRTHATAVLDAIRGAEDAAGQRRCAVIETGDLAAGDPALRNLVRAARTATRAQVRSYEPDRIVLEVEAVAAGVLVLNETWFRGWQVTVDGADRQPVRANYLSRGVYVGAGRHVVEWRYRPPHRRVLVGAWLAGAALFAGGLAFGWWRRRARA